MKSKHLLLMLLIALLAPWAANAQTVLNEGFESTTFPPDDWTPIHVSGTNSWARYTSYHHTGDASAYAHWASNGHENYLITPKLVPAAGEALTFYVAAQSYSGTTLKIELSTTTPTADAFTTELASYTTGSSGTIGTTSPSTWVEKTIPASDLAAYVGQQIYIAFHVIDANGGDVLIDDVTGVSLWVPACPKPSGLTATLTPGNGSIATLSWTENGEAGKWMLQYSTDETFTDNVVEIANGFNVDGSTVSANLTGLTAETQYYARVKSICDEESDWCSTVCQFKPTNAYTFFVNETATNSLSYIPFYYYTGSYNYIKSQFIVPSTALVNAQWGTINKLTFYYNTATSNYGTSNFSVYVTEVDNTTMTSMAEWATMTEVYTGTLSVADNMMTVEFTTPYNYQEGNLLVGFKLNSTGSSGTSSTWVGSTDNATGVSMYSSYSSSPTSSNFIPKMKVEYLPGEMPTCWQPQNMEASDVTNESAVLTWQRHAHGEETAWVLQYGTDNTFTTNTTTVNVNTNPTYTIVNGLAASTTYYVRVKPACDNDGNLWSEVIDFETGAACMVPNQIAVSDVTAHEATLTWNGNNDKFIVERGAYNNSGTPTAVTVMNEGFEGGSMPDGWSTEGISWAIGAGSGHSYTTTGSGSYNAYYYNSNYANYGRLITPALDLSGAASATLSFKYTNPVWSGGRHSLSVYYRVNGGEWIQIGSTITASHDSWINSDEYELPGLASNYEICFYATGYNSDYGHGVGVDDVVIEAEEYPVVWTVVDDNVPQSGNAGTFTFENLDPETTYFARVSGRCGSDVSDPSETVSFTTTIACPAPTNLDYVSSTLTAHGVDLTWDVNGNPTTDYKLYLNGEESNIVVNILEGVATYNLAGLDGETEYTVKVKANCGSLDGFSAESNEVTFTTEISCYTPTDLVMDDHTTESITVDWTNGSAGQEKWEVAYKEAESTGDFTVITNVSENPYTIGGLNDGTTYTVKVRANCGNEDGFSLWSVPVSMATVASCSTPVNVAVTDESETAHGATLTWEGTAAKFQVEYGVATAVNFSESFDGSSIPDGWSTTSTNWGISGDGHAGGTGYEVDLNWSPQIDNGVTRLITPALNLSGIISVTVSFKHMLDYYDGSYTRILGIATSSDGGTTWNTGWSQNFTNDVAATTISQTIATPDMGMDNVLFCIYFQGDSYGIDDWYFDDFEITGVSMPSSWTVADANVANNENAGTYTFTTLDPETTYYARVKGNCGGVLSPASDAVSFTTLVACQIPTDLTNATPEPLSVELSWTENGTADKWELCVDGDEENLVTVTSEDVDIEGSVVSHLLEGLSDDADHTVKVRANCGTEGASGWSNTVEFHTPVACEVPTDLEVSDITANTAELTWISSTGNYEVRYAEGVAESLVYDNGTFGTGIGTGSNTPFYWAVMHPAGTYTDSYLQKVSVFDVQAMTGQVMIYNDGDDAPADLVGTMDIELTGSEEFVDFDFEPYVTIDPAKNLWIVIYNESGATYPAAAYVEPDEANARWVSFDGTDWDDVGPMLSTSYGWMLRAFAAPSATFPEYGTPVSYTETTYPLDGLTPATGYTVQVRNDCGSIFGKSKWVTTSFETLPTCTEPEDLAVDGTPGAHSATLTWTAEDGDQFEYYLAENPAPGFIPADGDYELTLANTSTMEYSDGLNPETSYTFFLRKYCGSTDHSDVVSVDFTTDIACYEPTDLAVDPTDIAGHTATLTWEGTSPNYNVEYRTPAGNNGSMLNEDFNSLTTNNSIPEGWDNTEGTTTTASYRWCYNTNTSGNGATNGTSHDGSKCVRFNSFMNGNGNTNFLMTPTMNFPAGKVMQLTFWWKNPAGDDFSVLISTDGGSTQTPLLEGLTGQSTWKQESINLTDYMGASNVTIHFKGTSNYGNGDAYIYLDDVVVGEELPAGTTHTATVDENSASLAELTPKTKYEARVQGDCGSLDGTSAWTDWMTFTTGSATVTPTLNDVTVYTSSTATISWTGSTNNTEHQSYELYWALSSVTAVPDEPAAPNYITGITDVSKIINGLDESTEYNVWVRDNCGTDGYSDWAGPKNFTTTAACPKPENVQFSNLTNNSVTITWNGGDATTFMVFYQADGAAEWDKKPVENTTTCNIDGLTASTHYTVQVQATSCSEGELSDAIDFTTKCNPITDFPWTEDFESYSATSGYNSTGTSFSDPCWVNERITDGTGSSGSLLDFQVSTFNSSYTNGSNTTVKLLLPDMKKGTITKLVLPGMELPSSDYIFSMDIYRATGSYENEGVRVFVSTDGELTGATELAFIPRCIGYSNSVIPSVSAAGWYTYDLPLGISGTCYIILQGESQYGSATWMDNFRVGLPEFEKEIDANKWYAISSPVNTPAVADVENLTTGTYDLYRYDEVDGTWENKGAHADFTTFENGRGYIYRRANNATLTFTGVPNTGLITYTPTFGCSDVEIKGFNLVGNPYPESAGISYDCYTLNANGTWTIHPSDENYEIGMAEGVMVNVAGTEPIQFTAITTKSAHNAIDGLALSVSGNGYEDVVYARLEDGKGMPKLGHLAAEAPALSIPVEGRNYAIAYVGEEAVSFPLVLNAQSGNYTLNTANSTLPYVHLIDRVAGRDIDLLRQSYTFAADGNSNRFTVLLSPRSLDDAEGDIAIWNGTGWTINGDGTLQVFDVLGRKVYSQEVAEQSTLNTDQLSTGVYVLRMGEKSQKIVVK